jgi:hypothetical protein
MNEPHPIARTASPRVKLRRSWLPLSLIPIAAAIGAWSLMTTAPVSGNGFVGRLETKTDLIAIAPEGNEVIAFISDNGIRATWFRGNNRSPLELRADDGSVLRARLEDEQLIGEVRFVTARGSHRFVAQPATNNAGLYRTHVNENGQRLRVGWVMLNDGTQAGTLRLTSNKNQFELNPKIVAAPRLEPNRSVQLFNEFVTPYRVQ